MSITAYLCVAGVYLMDHSNLCIHTTVLPARILVSNIRWPGTVVFIPTSPTHTMCVVSFFRRNLEPDSLMGVWC